MIPSNNAIPSSPSSTTTSATTTDYLSIEDLHQLFFHHSSNDLNPLLLSLYRQHPHHFYYDRRKTCYIAKQHVLDLARSLHLFALAEFCALNHDELLHRVADPLFAITNAVMLRPVTPKRMFIDVDWFPLPSNDDSFFFSMLNSDPQTENADNAATTHSNADNAHSTTKHRHDFPLSFFPTFKQNFHSWTHHFLPLQNVGLNYTFRAQKQQQAIIECRMRLLVYRQSLPAAIQQKQQQQQTKKSTSTKPASPVNTNNTATKVVHHDHDQQRKRKSSPPSPPSFHPPSKKVWSTGSSSTEDYYTNHPHRYHHQQPSPSMEHNPKRLKSLYSNLDLLATQATKMKGLPLSPEISPPPHPAPSSVLSLPPITTTSIPPSANTSSFYSSSFIQSISLPSIRNVLSDI